jgi:hypothetical protein
MKTAEERDAMQASQWIPTALLGALFLCCLSSSGCTQEAAADQTTPRADLIAIGERLPLEELERPSVLFPHDLHTEVMTEREGDCTLCHPANPDAQPSSSFQRLEEIAEDDLIDLYHDECIGCHQETADAGQLAGPVACGDCHQREPLYASSRLPFGMDKSLHYRHVKATEERCEACHHVYKAETDELVYAKGEESSCRDCHREKTEENRRAFQVVAHQACIGCHREPPPEIAVEEGAAGPQFCADCHDLDHQLAIERTLDPPRLDRGQEDFLLLSASEADLEWSELRTVPFSHVDHEAAAESCRVCHHETLDRCSECHTLKGGEESDGVTLYQATHSMTSDHSCVGCHESGKRAQTCAGCHDQMEQGHLPEAGCDACHAGPLPERLQIERSRFRSLDDFRPGPAEVALSFVPDEIPETVEIGALSDRYEPAVMPHRKILEKLREHIGESTMASYFHVDEDVVCQGCHHQSPRGEKPPLCESCHRAESADLALAKPALQGAYHQQCLGCHESMGLQEPSDCTGCHEEKREVSETLASSAVR